MIINTSDFFKYDTDLAETVLNEYSRYESVLNEALSEFMQGVEKSFEMKSEDGIVKEFVNKEDDQD